MSVHADDPRDEADTFHTYIHPEYWIGQYPYNLHVAIR